MTNLKMNFLPTNKNNDIRGFPPNERVYTLEGELFLLNLRMDGGWEVFLVVRS